MSIEDDVKILNDIADKDFCEGDCDDAAPYEKCPECMARSTLNEVGSILRYAIEYIEK